VEGEPDEEEPDQGRRRGSGDDVEVVSSLGQDLIRHGTQSATGGSGLGVRKCVFERTDALVTHRGADVTRSESICRARYGRTRVR
jgi:hypothetical protein